jgi:site-specific DNA-cytosine methylase
MKYLSVCSGIEAATVAWHPLNWEPVAFSEIDAFPSAVLSHHYPNVPNWGDMTQFKIWPDADLDLLVGGTPCQSFSVAGLRKGLDDPRGNLMLTYLAIADRYRPKWLVWENVPGVLSSNGGRDFGAFLGALGQLGYGFAYRVLDAQFFGVAQRRRRVFVVGYLGDWRRAAAVLFERESLSGHPAPSREKRQKPAGTIAARFGISRNNAEECVATVSPSITGGPPFSRTGNERVEADALVVRGVEIGPSGGRYTDVVPTLDTRAKDGPMRNQVGACVVDWRTTQTENDISPTLKTDLAKMSGPCVLTEGLPDTVGTLCRQDHRGLDSQHQMAGYVVPVMRMTAFGEYVEDGTASAMKARDYKSATDLVVQPVYISGIDNENNAHGADQPTGPLMKGSPTGGGRPLPAVVFQQNCRDEVRLIGGDGQTVGALQAQSGMKQTNYVAFGAQNSASQGLSASEHITPTLDKSKIPGVVASFKCGQGAAARSIGYSERFSPTLTSNAGGNATPALLAHSAVRRLTPVECERLQGFPDGYTAIPYRGKPADACPDSPRYKALGNSMAVPVMAWIGRRIQLVHDL